MHLARHEVGKSIQLYEIDDIEIVRAARLNEDKSIAVIKRQPKTWVCYPRLGNANRGATSNLCNMGYAAIAESAHEAVKNVMAAQGE